MSSWRMRKLLWIYLALLAPIALIATHYAHYALDGDAVAYLDLAELIRGGQWAGVVNGYWHPGYPAVLALGEMLFRSTRWNELRAAYAVNFVLFLLSGAAMLWFTDALSRLRHKMSPDRTINLYLIGPFGMRVLGLAFVVLGAQRELATNFIRPDAMLQLLMLCGFAALAETLAGTGLGYPALMGVFFGLAYLTKSFAFVIGLLSIATMAAYTLWPMSRGLKRALSSAVVAVACFAVVAGPYIAALSHQKGRFDFGDSGALNYAWYAGGVEKMHLEPWMKDSFGPADVHLVHPERQIMASPPVYSYKAVPFGTYPDWFDTTYFNERVIPHLNTAVLARRDTRNLVLVLRYMANHPEGWALLLLLTLGMGANWRLRRARPGFSFAAPFVLLSLAMWVVYGLVNIEERYVTLAYLLAILPLFAALRPGARDLRASGHEVGPETILAASDSWQRRSARAAVCLLAVLSLAEMLRVALDERRHELGDGRPAWMQPQVFSAAVALGSLGVRPGDQVACMGAAACLNENYWARLSGVRITTEVYGPNTQHLLAQWEGVPNRRAVLDALRTEDARVLVASLPLDISNGETPDATGWVRLGDSDLYALPLAQGLTPGPGPAAMKMPWTTTRESIP